MQCTQDVPLRCPLTISALLRIAVHKHQLQLLKRLALFSSIISFREECRTNNVVESISDLGGLDFLTTYSETERSWLVVLKFRFLVRWLRSSASKWLQTEQDTNCDTHATKILTDIIQGGPTYFEQIGRYDLFSAEEISIPEQTKPDQAGPH